MQSDLQCIQAIHVFVSMYVPWELNPQPFTLLTQCSTTEPQEHVMFCFYFNWLHVPELGAGKALCPCEVLSAIRNNIISKQTTLDKCEHISKQNFVFV